jgi:hypothetical protein
MSEERDQPPAEAEVHERLPGGEADGPAAEAEDDQPAAPPSGAVSEEETVDGLPVLSELRTIERGAPAYLPAVQVAAAAATGFVAGAATIALVKRHGARKIARARPSAPRRAVDILPIVGSRTFLIDVHLVGRPEE